MKKAQASVWARFWSDDDGAILAIEWLFLVTIIVIGLITGYVGVRDAVVAELTEMGNAVLALSQGYMFDGLTKPGIATTDGSMAIDTPGLLVPPLLTPPAIPSVIDVVPEAGP
jgi:Flp pilus assembly pilin Flp